MYQHMGRFSRSLLLLIVIAFFSADASAIKYRKKSDDEPAPIRRFERVGGMERANVVPARLKPFYSESGRLSLSVDGLGTGLSLGTVMIDKPAGARVRRAYVIAAASGFSGYEIKDGDVRVGGVGVIWDEAIPNGVRSSNAIADVTELLRARIDGAPAGRIPLDIEEPNSEWIDGVILAVVFDDPSKVHDTDVALYWGSQAASGGDLTIDLPRPVAADASTSRIRMGIGITYGLQSTSTTNQCVQIDVNGQRLTTAAGGPDDGSPLPGALLTVGGVGDDPSNPADAFAMAENMASDDEYYDLTPFVRVGDEQIKIVTESTSRDDNLFFASITAEYWGPGMGVVSPLGGTLAAAPLGAADVRLEALSAESPVGGETRLTATVTREGQPAAGEMLTLSVVAGPHVGAVTKMETDENGRATFRYRGVGAGTDSLVASVLDGEGEIHRSSAVVHVWASVAPNGFLDVTVGACPSEIDASSETLTAALLGSQQFDVAQVDPGSLFLGNVAPISTSVSDVSRPGSSDDCPCSSEGADGYDDLVLVFRTAEVFSGLGPVSNGDAVTLLLTGRFERGQSFEASDCCRVSGVGAKVEEPVSNVLSPVTTESIDM